MSTKSIQRVVFALVILLLLLASFFAGRLGNQPINVQAQEELQEEDRAVGSFDCNVDEIALFSNRAHIRCLNTITVGTDTVRYFAIANTAGNKTLINRVLAIGLTQISMNRRVFIYFDDASINNPASCLASNCRRLVAITGFK